MNLPSRLPRLAPTRSWRRRRASATLQHVGAAAAHGVDTRGVCMTDCARRRLMNSGAPQPN